MTVSLLEEVSPVESSEPTPRRWSVDEYYRMVEAGFFQDQRVELVEGEVLRMAPQNIGHSVGIDLVSDVLREAFGKKYWIRIQMPLRVSDNTELEPDVAVVAGRSRDHKEQPSSALLAIEISQATIRFDRGKKAALYAKAGVKDYWILNLKDRCLEVYRDPTADVADPSGWRYASVTRVLADQKVAPLARPGNEIAVSDMLP
jgi:Uma2 family endonuclease